MNFIYFIKWIKLIIPKFQKGHIFCFQSIFLFSKQNSYFLYCCCCSFAKSSPTLCDPVDYSMPGFSVLCLPWVCLNSCLLSQWCYATISSSVTVFTPSLNLSQHQGLLFSVRGFYIISAFFTSSLFSASMTLSTELKRFWTPTFTLLNRSWELSIYSPMIHLPRGKNIERY